MGSKKNKGKKRAPEGGKAAKPAVPTARLSADAAEWHPPSLIAATAEADIIGQQPEPISVAEVDTSRDNPPDSFAAAALPPTYSMTPPSTRDAGEEEEEEQEQDHEGQDNIGQAPHSSTAVAPSDSPAADLQESVLDASPAAVASSEPAVQERLSLVEEADGTAAAGEVAGEEATPVLPAAAASPAPPAVPTKEAGAEATGNRGQSDDHSAQPHAALPEVVAPSIPEDSSTGAGAATAQDVPCAGPEGGAGGKTADTVEDAEGYARGPESTDVTSSPTDDGGSDPDLSSVGDGSGDGSKLGGMEGGRGSEEGRLGFLENPALRWGGAAALVGALLVIGLRRAR
eukprot:g6651.t1